LLQEHAHAETSVRRDALNEQSVPGYLESIVPKRLCTTELMLPK
jgi:hypothetical protein